MNQLKLDELGFARAAAAETGRPRYDPGDLLKLYIYGYMNGVCSSRKLERERNEPVLPPFTYATVTFFIFLVCYAAAERASAKQNDPVNPISAFVLTAAGEIDEKKLSLEFIRSAQLVADFAGTSVLSYTLIAPLVALHDGGHQVWPSNWWTFTGSTR